MTWGFQKELNFFKKNCLKDEIKFLRTFQTQTDIIRKKVKDMIHYFHNLKLSKKERDDRVRVLEKELVDSKSFETRVNDHAIEDNIN